MKQSLVSVVIPTYNRKDDLVRLLKSIKESDYPYLEVIIIDNASDPELEKSVKAVIDSAKIITPGRNVFSNGARRRGADAAKGKYIFLLDDDNTLEKTCISELVEALDFDSTMGAVGPVMLKGDSNEIWCAGGRLSSMGTPQYLYSGQNLKGATLPALIQDIDYFPNAWMIRREVLQKAPIDDQTFPHNWAETDFCLQILSAGYKMATVSSAVEHHHIGYSSHITRLGIEKTYDQAKSRLLFRRRHLPGAADWVKFWAIIFPVSSLVYLWHIIRSSESTNKMIGAYIRGTIDGLSSPMSRINPNRQETKA